MLLSIIIPVYNTEKYLDRCLNSIIKNIKNKTEIILIDDGSTDSSSIICDKYKNKYNFIKVIHQENKGLSVSRNKGIEISKGKYLWFIDGDDYIEDNSLDIIYNYLNKYDIIIFNYNTINNNITKTKSFYNYFNIETKYLLSHCPVWNKVFKKELFNNNLFPINHLYEDLYIVPTLILKTKNIIFLDNYLYNYQIRNNSIIKTFNNNEDRIYALDNLYDKLNNKYKEEIEYLFIYNLLITSLKEEVINNYKHDIKYINKYVKNKYNKYYKNKYLKSYIKIYLFLLYFNLIFIVRIITYIEVKYENN